VSLRERFRAWLESTGWWYGRLKPCDCPRDERYWGLATTPQATDDLGAEYEPETRETTAATVTEWYVVRWFRCRECGVRFREETDIVAARRTEYDDGSVTTTGLDEIREGSG
jgi:hypothetical protein